MNTVLQQEPYIQEIMRTVKQAQSSVRSLWQTANNEIVLPQYNKQIKLQAGENIMEFTPTEKGTFTYTCRMGMLKNTITIE